GGDVEGGRGGVGERADRPQAGGRDVGAGAVVRHPGQAGRQEVVDHHAGGVVGAVVGHRDGEDDVGGGGRRRVVGHLGERQGGRLRPFEQHHLGPLAGGVVVVQEEGAERAVGGQVGGVPGHRQRVAVQVLVQEVAAEVEPLRGPVPGEGPDRLVEEGAGGRR